MAQFAIPTPDENLVPGWNVQGNFASASTVGIPGAGYSQAGVVGAATTYTGSGSQAGSGYPSPPGALNIGSENSGSYSKPILSNPLYANAGSAVGQSAIAPIPTTTGVQQPFSIASQAAIVCPTGVTSISVAPWTAAGAGTYTSVWSGTLAAVTTNTVTVPPAGYIKTAGANATSVVYTATM